MKKHKKEKEKVPTLSFRPTKKNKTLIADLRELADKENRRLNNYVEVVLVQHVADKNK